MTGCCSTLNSVSTFEFGLLRVLGPHGLADVLRYARQVLQERLEAVQRRAAVKPCSWSLRKLSHRLDSSNS